MGLFDKIFGPKPRIAKSQPIDVVRIKPDPMSIYKKNIEDYYIAASVEVGNTTTKCILTATNMSTGMAQHVNKTVRMTRDVRPPKEGEEVFGRTLTGVPLTRESVSELVSETITDCLVEANIDIKTNLHFVVRSTGVVAGFATPEEVGNFILALADGCLKAGVMPKNMTPAMSIDTIPEQFKKHTLIGKVVFLGAVAGVLPPTGATGVEIVANEMEGELATAGIKEGAKWARVDFRNPCLSLDFGTTLDGRITNSDTPYAKTIGNFCGLAGAIPDAIVQGTGLVDQKTGTALDVFKENRSVRRKRGNQAEKYAEEIHEHISIEIVPEGRDRYGSVPVDAKAAKKIGVVLIGCDVGKDGSDLPALAEIGKKIYEKHGIEMIACVIDHVAAISVGRLVQTAIDAGLVTKETAIGITGRAGISGNKPAMILDRIIKMGFFDDPESQVIFVDDGLARGAAVMARCMNSLGVPNNPIGGNRGGGCVLAGRMALQNNNVTK
ncbi:MAG TPA: methanogenesis marker 14 protein [Methanosarcinales archaeon]|nr:methanogenesis marker 14 protein [Methanosarcinales archaeon]